MSPRKIQLLNQQLKAWRAKHQDAASLRAAYRAKVVEFTLNSMALENEPVDRQRLQAQMNAKLGEDEGAV